MNDKLLIKSQYRKILIEIFQSYCPKAQIWAYGSRLNGDAHNASDLDLVVKDFHSKTANLHELREILSESNIPFIVDINEFDNLPSSFQEEIQKKLHRNFSIIY